MKVVWTGPASGDIEHISTYILNEFGHDPSDIAIGFLECVKPLCDHPRLGRMVPEIAEEEIREIIAVIHDRQDRRARKIEKTV